jgi:putative copper export protein
MTVPRILLHTSVRWLDFIALTILVGGVAFRHLIGQESLGAGRELERFERNCRRTLAISIALAAVTSVGDLILRTLMMTRGAIGDLGPALPVVLRGTHYGAVWVARIGLIGVLATACLLRSPALGGPSRSDPVLAVVACVLTLTTTLSGHAADWGDLTVPVLIDWLHLLAISIWIGGVFMLGFVLPAAVARPIKAGTTERLASIAARFSRVAACCAVVYIGTGLYNAWLQVASFSPLSRTSYGWTLLAKLSLLLVALSLAALNRYYFLPRLRTDDITQQARRCSALRRFAAALRIGGGQVGEENVPARFFGAVRLEWAVAVGMLACSALLTQLPPARHIRRHEHREQHVAHRPALVESAARPAVSDGKNVLLDIIDRSW